MVLALATGCWGGAPGQGGQGPAWDPSRLGSCPKADPGASSAPGPDTPSAMALTWLEVSDVDLRADGERPTAVQLPPATVIGLPPGDTIPDGDVALEGQLSNRIRTVGRGPQDQQAMRWLIGLAHVGDALGSVAIAEHGDGSIVALGQCTAGVTDHVARFVSAEGSAGRPITGTQVALASISDPGGIVDQSIRRFLNPPPITWTELPPDQRSVNPQDTPAALMVGTRKVTVGLVIPDEWRTYPLAARTETPFGGGLGGYYLGAGPGPAPIPLDQYVRPGDPVTVFLVSEGVNPTRTVVITIPPEAWRGVSYVEVDASGSIDAPQAVVKS